MNDITDGLVEGLDQAFSDSLDPIASQLGYQVAPAAATSGISASTVLVIAAVGLGLVLLLHHSP